MSIKALRLRGGEVDLALDPELELLGLLARLPAGDLPRFRAMDTESSGCTEPSLFSLRPRGERDLWPLLVVEWASESVLAL